MNPIEQYSGSKYFMDGQHFCIVRFEEYSREDAVFHTHDFVEICYVCRGFGHHCVDGKEFGVSKGHLFIINYDMSHSFYRAPECDQLVTYNLLLTPDFLNQILVDLDDFDSSSMSYVFNGIWASDGSGDVLRLTIAEQFDFDALFNHLYQEYTEKRKGYVNMVRAYVIEMITKILRCYSTRGKSDVTVRKKADAIDSIKSYLQNNYSHGFSLEDLARQSFFSKNYLCKIFKEITGHTISDYMLRLRIEEACKLLSDSESRILDIALEVGFSDYKSFNSVFKRLMNMSAREYKKAHSARAFAQLR